MSDTKPVKIGYTGRNLRELKMNDEYGEPFERESELTNCKRFASGLDLVYSIKFPFGIHSERIRKQRGFVDVETPRRGKMLGWDKYFHPRISRQKRWLPKVEQRGRGGLWP